MGGARSALIVASYNYSDPGLKRLHAPASDAQALSAVLQDPGIGGFEVRTLLNEPAHEVNLAVEEFFADRRPDDLLLLHFSCHGVKDEGGELYFAMTNTMLRRLGATAVAAEFVNKRMSRSRSRRIVLLLDCCYAGAFERGMTARAGTGVGVESQFGGRGRAVITASSAMEYAFEGDELADARELAPSVFTSALVEGLETGEADRDQDGLVALDELYDYVYDKVRTATPNQTPGKWTFGVQGELIIAQRAQPVTVPAPLPRELQEAIDSPLAAVRGAAVQELARLLHGRHAGLALAAQLSLERLVNDDSRTVTTAAIAALGAQPQQAQPEQELPGQEPPGQEPPEPEPLAHVEHTPVPEPRAAAAIIQSKAPLGDPKAGQLGKKDRTAQEAGHSPAPTAAGLGAPSRTSNNRLLLAAGTLAVVGGVLIAIQLYLPYTQGFLGASRLADLWSGMIQAAVFACAGIFILVPHTRRLIGPGLLLGAVAIEPSGPVTNILNGRVYGDVGAGLMLDVTAGVVLTVAGCISGLALARAGDVHAGPRLPEGIFAWLVAILGVVGAVTFIFQVLNEQVIPGTNHSVAGQDMPGLVWGTAMAVLVPTAAAIILPRQFGVALLAGWIGTVVAGMVFYTGVVHSLTGLTLLALLAVIIPFARAAPPARASALAVDEPSANT